MNLLKNKDIVEFLKKECVLVIALILAIMSSFISIPKLKYIDFRVLMLLFNLMIIVAAFKQMKVLDFIAISILKKCKSYRSVSVTLVFITFVAAMFVTNDVALITFVPLTIIIGKSINMDVLETIVLETIAANAGSSLTPMGNPQNIFIYTYYNINPLHFFMITLPIVILGGVILLFITLRSECTSIKFNLEDIKVKDRFKLTCFIVLLIIILLSVFHMLDYKIAFIVTLITVIILDKRLIAKVDYSLLLTFVGFFIFVGNISNMTVVKEFMSGMLNGANNTYVLGILASQIISNVPSAMLLSSFTHHYKELLLSVNIGGLGTLIASLASVISYKIYVNEYKYEAGRYLKSFTIYNFVILAIISIIIKIALV